jgi:hypothetical protein
VEDDVVEGSTEYLVKFVARHSSSEGEVTGLELGQVGIAVLLLAVQTQRDHRIAQQTDELSLKSSLLGQAEAKAVEAARRAWPGYANMLIIDGS